MESLLILKYLLLIRVKKKFNNETVLKDRPAPKCDPDPPQIQAADLNGSYVQYPYTLNRYQLPTHQTILLEAVFGIRN